MSKRKITQQSTVKDYRPIFSVNTYEANKIISLLLLLAEKRIKSFPRILGVIESMMFDENQKKINSTIEMHLNNLLKEFAKTPEDNRYLICTGSA